MYLLGVRTPFRSFLLIRTFSAAFWPFRFPGLRSAWIWR